MKRDEGTGPIQSPWSPSPPAPTGGAGPSSTSLPQSAWRRWLQVLATFRPRTHEPTTLTVSMPAAVTAVLDSSSIQRITLMLGSSLMWTMLAVLGRRKHSVEHTARLLFYVSMGAFVGVLSCTLRMTRPQGSFAVNASVVLRGFTTAIAFGARFMSLIHLRIVDSAALTSMAPVLTGLPSMARSTTLKPVWFLFSLVNMGEMSAASQTAFAYVFFVSKARETDQGLANMYKYAMDVLMACALTWTFLPDDVVPAASYGAAVLVLCAVVTAEVQRLSCTPRPPPGARVIMRFFM
ncbi:hypothetical protein HPB50_002428 [Hyalomma asiaticum]|uniref:Uncharacterized protein n=1 Tax=Hyalomma asiaticum TaxID=266040 RepID=A0ACB7SDK8_HYAAI|nr:hypothetical protein HPB50_002428 [Hyalomma asiaticum]